MSLAILLVEDEALIAMMAQDMIETLGHSVAATAATLKDATAAVAAVAFDVALLDVNLNGDSSVSVAQELIARGTPFAFTTGYGSQGIDEAFADVPVLPKPYALSDLEVLLVRLDADARAIAER